MRFPKRALRLGRVNAESLMVDSVRVERFTGERVRDPVTLKDVDVFSVVYQGRGKIQAFDGQYERAGEAGGGNVLESRSHFHAPLDAGPFLPGDRVTIVVAPLDPPSGYGFGAYGEGVYGEPLVVPERSGDVFQILAVTGKTAATAQRLPVTRVEAVR